MTQDKPQDINEIICYLKKLFRDRIIDIEISGNDVVVYIHKKSQETHFITMDKVEVA